MPKHLLPPSSKTFGSRIAFMKVQSPGSDDSMQSPECSPLEVTEGSLQVWRNLPEKIRQDPSLASFRQEHERLHGDKIDDDPLPNEDVSGTDSQDGNSHKEYITINVTNSEGQLTNFTNGVRHATTNEATDTEQDHDHDDTDAVIGHKKPKQWVTNVKIGLLLVVWLAFTFFLMRNSEKHLEPRAISVPQSLTKSFLIDTTPPQPRLALEFHGAFMTEHYNDIAENYMYVYLKLIAVTSRGINDTFTPFSVDRQLNGENITEVWRIPIVPSDQIDTATEITRRRVFTLDADSFKKLSDGSAELSLQMYTDIDAAMPLLFEFDPTPVDVDMGIIYATAVLIGLYIMIIWEIVHRTFAAIIASTMALGILAMMGERPTMELLISWIDVETLLLLFGMMILVAILSETGIFDFLAVYAYKITNGKIWPLINCLCLFTAITSAFLDNVTTVLLMTPVTIRLCEVMELNPVPILMSMVIYSNIGGTLTPVGDPPNVIIASNSYITRNGVNFTIFTMHMAIGVIMVMIQAYFQLRFKFRNINSLRFSEAQDVQELRHEIAVWQRAAASLSSYSKDEDLVRETLCKKVNRLNRNLKKKLVSGSVPIESYKSTLEELMAKYPIRNKTLLIKSSVALVFVITFFFLHSAPELQRLSLGWTALLGAILLLILADREDMESVLARVEWGTLLFFAALFILMEALSELGLIDWIGRQTENVILSVSVEHRLTVAILIILWVSALASAFVDNIPLTTMMIKIAISLAENEALGLPLQPLVWSLAFGACLGGNGTLIGASANVVCAGVAEQHGYKFTFVEFFKVGFPVMIGSIIVATVYLMICHVVFEWH